MRHFQFYVQRHALLAILPGVLAAGAVFTQPASPAVVKSRDRLTSFALERVQRFVPRMEKEAPDARWQFPDWGALVIMGARCMAAQGQAPERLDDVLASPCLLWIPEDHNPRTARKGEFMQGGLAPPESADRHPDSLLDGNGDGAALFRVSATSRGDTRVTVFLVNKDPGYSKPKVFRDVIPVNSSLKGSRDEIEGSMMWALMHEVLSAVTDYEKYYGKVPRKLGDLDMIIGRRNPAAKAAWEDPVFLDAANGLIAKLQSVKLDLPPLTEPLDLPPAEPQAAPATK